MNYEGVPMLSHSEVVNLIASAGDEVTFLVEGENGIGKSSLHKSLRMLPQFRDYIFPAPVDCAQLDVGDHTIPVPDFERGISRNLPNERYGINENNQRGVPGAVPVVVMLDEMAKMPKHLQASLAPFFFEHRLGRMYTPEKSIIFGSTNLSIEGLGDFMPAHTRNRITVIRMRKPTKDEWIQQFAVHSGIVAEVQAFAEEFEMIFDSFIDYEKGGKHHGKNLAADNPHIFNPYVVQSAYCTPRSLHKASNLIRRCQHLPVESLQAALAGTVGEQTARAMSTYIEFGRVIPSYERIVVDPEGTPVPTEATAQIVLAFKLVSATTNREYAEAVCKYAKRLREEMTSLFLYTAAHNSDRVTKFVSVDLFHELLRAHEIYFDGAR